MMTNYQQVYDWTYFTNTDMKLRIFLQNDWQITKYEGL